MYKFIALAYSAYESHFLKSVPPPPCKEPQMTSFPQNLVIKIQVLITDVLLFMH